MSALAEVTPPIRYRKLRIAWSVMCGVACVLLCVLWLRSYYRWDQLSGEAFDNTWILVRSLHGEIAVCGGYDARSPLIPLTWSTYNIVEVRYPFVTANKRRHCHFP